jgi:formylmethanofuran dehydrogenase subunit B
MSYAAVDGNTVTVQEATAEAARLLAQSRFPLVAGLGTDVAGARAAIALAQRVGAAIDHMNADALLKDLDVMRDTGMMLTTPNEARVRADTVLLVGPGLAAVWPDLSPRLLRQPTAPEADGGRRRVMWICAGREVADDATVKMIGGDPADLPAVLAALRARLARRPIGAAPLPGETLDALAADLAAARFGVAVWSAQQLDVLAIEMLCGIVKDLNGKTRFTGLPLSAGDNGEGIVQVCGWLTGFPMRTGFGRFAAEHDPWRFDARRMVEAGEIDCALWISAYRAAVPEWSGAVPIIALTDQHTRWRVPPRVHIAVGRPGLDHDAVEHWAATGTLAPMTATKPSQTPSVARAITDILAAVPERGA